MKQNPIHTLLTKQREGLVGLNDSVEDYLEACQSELLAEIVKVAKSQIREVGNDTYCKTCKQHIAAGDCDCTGRNNALTDLINTLTEEK